MTALHLRGIFLPDESERDAWVVDGRLTFTRPSGEADTIATGGWITPGFVDAHCHVGLAAERARFPTLTRRPSRRCSTAQPARCCCATPVRRSTTAASRRATTCRA